MNNNIKAVHIDDTIMMEVEKLIYNVNSEIASIIRSVRLSHDAMDNMGKMFKNPHLGGYAAKKQIPIIKRPATSPPLPEIA